MKTDIKISTRYDENNRYKGNVFIGTIALFCGVLSFLMFFGGLNAISYTAELVYMLAFIMSCMLGYSHYRKPGLSYIIFGITFVCMALGVIVGWNDIQLQFMSIFTALSEGTAAVRNVTGAMCIIAVLSVIMFYCLDLVARIHWILILLLTGCMLVSPFLKLSVSVFNVFTIILYLLLFYVLNNTSKKSRRRKNIYIAGSVHNNRIVLERAAAFSLVVIIISFIISNIIMNVIPEPVYRTVSSTQESVYRVANQITGRGADINMDGSISSGNNYQTGVEQLSLSADRKPEQDIYLIGYRGLEYTGNNWSHADDTKLCNEYDITYAPSYTTINGTADAYNHLYYTCNYTIKNGGFAAVSKDKERRISLDVELKGNRDVSLEPYCSSAISDKGHNGIRGYFVKYYEQSDMSPDWTVNSNIQKRRVDDYTQVQSNYKEIMRKYYTQYSEEINPKIASYVKDNELSTLDEKTTFILYTLMSNTQYTRSPGLIPGYSDVADEFLFATKRGYCVHYATVATLMYRMYGIPARYVTGFRVSKDSFSEDDNGQWTASATDAMQHAWTEIFIDNYGWVPVDVTPTSDGIMNVSYPGYNMSTFNSIMEQHGWNASSPSIHNASDDNVEYVRTFRGKIIAGARKFFTVLFNIVRIAIIIVAIVLLVCSPYILNKRRKKMAYKLKNSNSRYIFNRMMLMLHTFGYMDGYEGTEEDFAIRLIKEFNNSITADVRRAVETAVEAEFSLHWEHDNHDKNSTDIYDLYMEISQLIYIKLKWYKKFIFKYIYCY